MKVLTNRFMLICTLALACLAMGQSKPAFAAPAPPPGTGKVTVTSAGPCLASSTNGQVFQWRVQEGATYTMTISGVTECTGDTITVFVQGSLTGNFCFNLTGGSGTYTGTFTMPNPACFTYPISYKCGADAPCTHANSFDAQGPNGEPSVHLRSEIFGDGCVDKGQDEDCGGTNPQGCILSAPPGGDLGCNPDASLYACGTATPIGCIDAAGITCTPGTPVNTSGCLWTVTNTYSATGCDGVVCQDFQTFTFTKAGAPVFVGCTPGTTDLGCNPGTLPSCDPNVTASNECGSVDVTCTPGDIISDGQNRSQSFVYSATASCGGTSTCTRTFTWTIGQICVTKFYDANLNGIRDTDPVTHAFTEPAISGFKITVTGPDGGVQTGYTDSTGQVCFQATINGDYTVNEVAPDGTWLATTPTSQTVTIGNGACAGTATFGNVCTSTPTAGLTLGFWSNSNGQKILTGSSTGSTLYAGVVTLLNSLNCRNADGTFHTFTNSYSAFRTWLLGASATNMAYMLSAQLVATTLDVTYKGLSDGTTVVIPGGVMTQAGVCIVGFTSVTEPITCGSPALLSLSFTPGSTACGCVYNNGFATIGAIRSRAICLLGAYGSVVGASTQRTYDECVKDILDMINNNGPAGYPCGGISQVNTGGSSCLSVTPGY